MFHLKKRTRSREYPSWFMFKKYPVVNKYVGNLALKGTLQYIF